jgi:hypothetical protein
LIEGEQPAITPHLELICQHFKRHLGGEFTVFHEDSPSPVHLDVLRFRPTAARPFQVLCSVGMSAKTVTSGGWFEVMLCLPASWEIDPDRPDDRWPIDVVRYFCQVVLHQNVRTRPFLSTPFGNPDPTPVGQTPFVAAMTYPVTALFPEAIQTIEAPDRQIEVYGLMLLTSYELQQKLDLPDGQSFWNQILGQGRPIIDVILADPDRASLL